MSLLLALISGGGVSGAIAANTGDATAAVAGTVVNPVTGTIAATTGNTTSAIAGNVGPRGTITATTAPNSGPLI